ncbi:hypothetical protein [Mucisphaera sp.]|uniref:hypothetical protein n=1 Tax=Mucisphaera sp. TaxID=2913024 RepID=UPI003D1243E7
MNDHNTHQALDDLADVFLTGTNNGHAPAPTPDNQQSTNNDHLRLSHTEEDDQPTERPSLGLEAVILGNLPGLGGAWLTQYAQHTADEHGTVALLHADDDALDLEIIGERRDQQPAPGRIPPNARDRDNLVETIDQLATNANAPLGRVLVHIEPYRNGTIQPAALSKLAGFDRWTILCGADDAAIVACYRMLKHLVEANPQNAPRRISLMVMGSSEIDGLEAARKVQTAAQNHLGRPIDLAGSLARMRPISTRPAGRFTPADRAWLHFRGWMDDLAHGEAPLFVPPAENTQSLHDTEAQSPTEEQAMTQPLAEPLPPTIDPLPDAAILNPAKETHHSRVGLHAQPNASPETVHSQEAPESTSVKTTEADAAALIKDHPDLGLRDALQLDARDPQNPDITLLLDAKGRLHLIYQLQKDAESSLDHALLQLKQTAAWATEHLQLLQLTQRQCHFDTTAEPILHLATEQPQAALKQSRRLDPNLRIHLLQHVRIANLTGWNLTPLI